MSVDVRRPARGEGARQPAAGQAMPSRWFAGAARVSLLLGLALVLTSCQTVAPARPGRPLATAPAPTARAATPPPPMAAPVAPVAPRIPVAGDTLSPAAPAATADAPAAAAAPTDGPRTEIVAEVNEALAEAAEARAEEAMDLAMRDPSAAALQAAGEATIAAQAARGRAAASRAVARAARQAQLGAGTAINADAAEASAAAGEVSNDASRLSSGAQAEAESAEAVAEQAARSGDFRDLEEADVALTRASEVLARAEAAREEAALARARARQVRADSGPVVPGGGPESGLAGSDDPAAGYRLRILEARRGAAEAEARMVASGRALREAADRRNHDAQAAARSAVGEARRERDRLRAEAESWQMAAGRASAPAVQPGAGSPGTWRPVPLPEGQLAAGPAAGPTPTPPDREPPAGNADGWQVATVAPDPRRDQPVTPPRVAAAGSETFVDCEVCPTMAALPAGRYMMGSPESEWGREASESPRHPVAIEQPFAIGLYEVTRGEFAAFVRESGYHAQGACLVTDRRLRLVEDRRRHWADPGYPQTDRDPVVCVSWRDTEAYVAWLSARSGRSYRLPSEAEWEYAARAGSETSQFWGDNPDAACGFANTADLSAARWIRRHLQNAPNPAVARRYLLPVHGCRDGYLTTAPVGSYRPNAFGLHDMIANVDEWVGDCWNPSYRGAPADGSPWNRGDCGLRVTRSGSWINGTQYNRAAHRDRSPVDFRHYTLGFRVVRDL